MFIVPLYQHVWNAASAVLWWIWNAAKTAFVLIKFDQNHSYKKVPPISKIIKTFEQIIQSLYSLSVSKGRLQKNTIESVSMLIPPFDRLPPPPYCERLREDIQNKKKNIFLLDVWYAVNQIFKIFGLPLIKATQKKNGPNLTY